MLSDSEGLQDAVLPVAGDDEEFDLDIPPTSGMEYLRRVQNEAKQCQTIVVADVDAEKLRKQTVKVYQSRVLPPPSGYAPSLQWQLHQVADFAHVRQKLARYKATMKKNKIKQAPTLPADDDVEGWCKLCFGRLKPPSMCETRNQEDETWERTAPLLSIMCAMNQTTVLDVLEYHVNWFEATGFTPEQGQWFYALLCCLEKPLIPEACSLIRELARNSANLRASLENSVDARLIPLNLIICLVSRYFNQMDLADDG
ncbi:unnamed protein product [Owenia fusiformis]|uniref:Gem-associated protein 2 n=1 Tax=Owenia fusiformis TaxID=6347 RepID=A0A8S4NTA6_OWEFU|nr:unnamed protein product [Owenia fusiformis]